MMDDHATLSRARNELADAMKALLREDIMTTVDFRSALERTVAALDAIAELLVRDP